MDTILGNGIGDEGAKAISEMLKMNTTLISLDLGSENAQKRSKQDKASFLNDRQWDER